MATAVVDRPLFDVVRARRATGNFENQPVDEQDLKQILQAGLEAPSAYNLQPWRFVVVRDLEQRRRLRQAAFGQLKVEEAPVVVVALGDPEGWKSGDMEQMIAMGRERGIVNDAVAEVIRGNISGFLGNPNGDVGGVDPGLSNWVNRHTMIAFTHMMLMAENLGYNTAPMEGFVESKVKEVLEIPAHIRVVALLAIGRRKGDSKPYGGRFPMSQLVFDNVFGKGLKL